MSRIPEADLWCEAGMRLGLGSWILGGSCGTGLAVINWSGPDTASTPWELLEGSVHALVTNGSCQHAALSLAGRCPSVEAAPGRVHQCTSWWSHSGPRQRWLLGRASCPADPEMPRPGIGLQPQRPTCLRPCPEQPRTHPAPRRSRQLDGSHRGRWQRGCS